MISIFQDREIFWISILAFFVFGSVAFESDCAAGNERPIPDSASQASATKTIHSLFPNDYAQRDPAAMQAFAEKLFSLVDAPGTDATMRFVLLHEAADVDARAGNVRAAGKIIDQMAAVYPINAVELKVGALAAALHQPKPAPDPAQAAGGAISVYDAAVAADDFKNAARCASLLRSIQYHDSKIAALVFARTQGLAALAAEYERCKSALVTLRADPASPAANEAVGSYECFTRGDWALGLPRLALSPDQSLAAAAHADLSQPIDPSEQVKLADAWDAVVGKHDDLSSAMIRRRAAYWYLQATPQLQGLAQAAARQRAQSMVKPNVEHGTIFFLSDMPEIDPVVGYGVFGKNGNCGFIGGRISVNGAPSPHGLGTHAVGYGVAHVAYELSGAFDTFKTGVAFNDSCPEVHSPLVFRVVGDGNVLWVSDPVEKVRAIQNCAINVLGIRKLTLELTTGDAGNAHAVWLEPQVIRK